MKVHSFWYEEAKGFILLRTINDNIPLVYHITTSKAIQYGNFRLMLKDLKDILDIISELKNTKYDGKPSVTKQSLSFYVVINYGKLYAEGGTQLNPEHSLVYCDTVAKEEHERIIHQRNNYVAHFSQSGYEHNPVIALLNRDEEKKSVLDITDNIMSLADIDSQLENFEKLVFGVIKYCEEKCQKLSQLIKTEIEEMNIEDLYKAAIDPKEYALKEIHLIDKSKGSK